MNFSPQMLLSLFNAVGGRSPAQMLAGGGGGGQSAAPPPPIMPAQPMQAPPQESIGALLGAPPVPRPQVPQLPQKSRQEAQLNPSLGQIMGNFGGGY